MSPRTPQQRTPASRLHRVLWADFTAGAVVGALLLALSTWLEAIYSIPRSVLLVMGAAGLLYACLALALASRPIPPSALVGFLGSANLVWATLCAVAALVLFGTATALGLTHLAVESVFVMWLGVSELRLRSTAQSVEAAQCAT
jgi:hypothetical protein